MTLRVWFCLALLSAGCVDLTLPAHLQKKCPNEGCEDKTSDMAAPGPIGRDPDNTPGAGGTITRPLEYRDAAADLVPPQIIDAAPDSLSPDLQSRDTAARDAPAIDFARADAAPMDLAAASRDIYSDLSSDLSIDVVADSRAEAGIPDAIADAIDSTPTEITLTLGKTDIGPTTDSGDANVLNSFRFSMEGRAARAVSVSIYVALPIGPAPRNQYALAIYSNIGGAPGNLIASTATGTLVGDAWNTLPLATPVTLAANETYWIAYNTNGMGPTENNYKYGPAASGQSVWREPFAFGPFPAAFGMSTGKADVAASIYVTLKIP